MTIHGFCNRILSQQAFSSGVAFNVQMERDTAEIELEAVRDWYRLLSKQVTEVDSPGYELLTRSWAAPESFYLAFRDILSSTIIVQSSSPDQIKENFQHKKERALQHLKDGQMFVFQTLIDSHKQADLRTKEWYTLIQWLSSDYFGASAEQQAMPKSASNVFHGVRFSRKDPDIKQQLNDIFKPIKALKDEAAVIEAQMQKSQSYLIAIEGINVIRKKIAQEKQRSKVMNYDDLINQLARALSSSSPSASSQKLAQLIKEQYPVALVDEFQDTDPQQYSILKAIYHNDMEDQPSELNDMALYMIGDPKQAIYAFRSGDVFTYLAARSDADEQWYMDTNWRSSSKMIHAYNRLFYGAPMAQQGRDVFGFDIQYTPVKPAGIADEKSLKLAVNNAALQFIHFPFNEEYQIGRSRKEEMNQAFCPVIASWCSAEIHQLLTENVSLENKDPDVKGCLLQEKDIAVLVRDKKEASYIQDALNIAGYSSVYLSTHDNVFLSEEAIELERALSGILMFENDRLFVAALSTRFFGGDTEQLYSLQEDEDIWEGYREKAFELRESWLKQGFMTMALTLIHQNFIPNPHYHERALTNTIQLLELLQQACQRHRQPEQLLNWLREQINAGNTSAEAELRLESDANLIRIITQHGSKGLEYPVVFIPFATRYKDPAKFGNKNIDLFKYHERDNNENKQGSYPLNYFIGQDKHITELYREEAWAETIRLLYVAITRAQFRCYVCATPFSNFYLSPLGQTLKLSSEDDLLHILMALSDQEPDSIHVQQINELEFPVTHHIKTEVIPQHTAAQFFGRIERNWWLSSFSALTRNLRHGGISTPDHDQNEAMSDDSSGTEMKARLEQETQEKLRFTLTKGAATGNLLHDILEHTDFAQPRWQRSMERPLIRFNETLDLSQQDELILWLEDCLNCSLGAPISDTNAGLQLNTLIWTDTLRETEFYFPMEQVKPHLLGRLLAGHRQQSTTIQLPGHNALQGMMHGFIDLIFQWQDKYYIIDYKSTYLGNRFEDYNQAMLEKNIRDNYYDLQYLLYSLALHRYLKLRKADYDPEQHFGGVHYLYLRGMTSESDNMNGIFSTHISAELLAELDELFAGSVHCSDPVTRASENV